MMEIGQELDPLQGLLTINDGIPTSYGVSVVETALLRQDDTFHAAKTPLDDEEAEDDEEDEDDDLEDDDLEDDEDDDLDEDDDDDLEDDDEEEDKEDDDPKPLRVKPRL